jgi:hypothetical protein
VLLDNQYANKVSYKRFTSIDINQSEDGIYYKNVVSDPNDTIDKMHLFNFGNQKAGENLFSTSSFQPAGVSHDDFLTSLQYKVPDVTPSDSNIDVMAINKFKVLDRCKFTSPSNKAIIDALVNNP